MEKVIIPLLAVCLHVVGYGQASNDTASVDAMKDSVAATKESGWLTVRSNPAGAEVYDGSQFLGVTPLDSVPGRTGTHVLRLFYPSARFWNSASETDTLTLLRAREKTCVIQFGELAGNGIFRKQTEWTENNPDLFLVASNKEDGKLWMGYAAGATMVISGALSAYLKTNSDNYFNSYLDNRDPMLLSKVRRLDRWAGITLFVSEISFGVVTYLLLSE